MSRRDPAAAETALLCDALEVAPERVSFIRREPLGPGSVAAFAVAGAPVEGDYFVDTSGLDVAVETGMALPGVARIWMHPADPHLPALAPTAYGGAAGLLLSRIGHEATDATAMVAYRPGRRAVLTVPTREGVVWLKVVRPSRVEPIVESHALLAASGIPVPSILAWSPEGLIALASAEGAPATEVAWHPEALLDVAEEVQSRFAQVPLRRTARTGLEDRLPWYTAKLAAVAAQPDAVRLISEQTAAALDVGRGEPRSIHGDLHLGQLFLTGDGPEVSLAGIIDVDTAGRGFAADDSAAFLSHAIASAILTENGGDAPRAWALADGALVRWGERPGVRGRAAVHLLGHALAAAEGGESSRSERLLGRAHDLVSESKKT